MRHLKSKLSNHALKYALFVTGWENPGDFGNEAWKYDILFLVQKDVILISETATQSCS